MCSLSCYIFQLLQYVVVCGICLVTIYYIQFYSVDIIYVLEHLMVYYLLLFSVIYVCQCNQMFQLIDYEADVEVLVGSGMIKTPLGSFNYLVRQGMLYMVGVLVGYIKYIILQRIGVWMIYMDIQRQVFILFNYFNYFNYFRENLCFGWCRKIRKNAFWEGRSDLWMGMHTSPPYIIWPKISIFQETGVRLGLV